MLLLGFDREIQQVINSFTDGWNTPFVTKIECQCGVTQAASQVHTESKPLDRTRRVRYDDTTVSVGEPFEQYHVTHWGRNDDHLTICVIHSLADLGDLQVVHSVVQVTGAVFPARVEHHFGADAVVGGGEGCVRLDILPTLKYGDSILR